MDYFIEQVRILEAQLGIRPGFFNELMRETDWGFIIKLHAFIEAALTEAICSHTGHTEQLRSVVARLDTANNQYGKIAFAKALGIIEKPHRRFISELCTLRNNLAHDVRQADFSFSEYMGSLTEQERYNFCISLSLDELFRNDCVDGGLQIISFVNEVPKFGICMAASILISDLYASFAKGELQQQYKIVGQRLVAQTMHALEVRNVAL